MIITESKFTTGSTHSFRDKMWECVFAVLFMYVFFIQNAFFSIGGAIIILCGVTAVFAVVNLMTTKRGIIRANNMFGIAVFVLVGFCTSAIYSNDFKTSMDIGLKMIEYLIIAFSLFAFLTSNPRRFFAIIRYIWLSITLLCVFVLFEGSEVTAAGGIGLETLNVNLLSSYITMQIFLSFLLMGNAKSKLAALCYFVSVVSVLFVQILSASRRGFVVACLLFFVAVFWGLIPRYTKSYSKKRIATIIILLIALVVAIAVVGEYVLNETVLGERLRGNFDSGDALRESYHSIALREFLSHPISGVGYNGLECIMGAYSHSLYYETLACTGLIGSIIMIFSMIILGGGVLRYAKLKNNSDPVDLYVSKMCFCFWCALLVSGVAVTTIYDFYFYICLAILSAVVTVNKRSRSLKDYI